MSLVVEAEKCRVCGCTETHPCVIRFEDEDHQETCAWLDFDHTLCTNPLCVARVPLAELLAMPILRAA